MMPVAKGHVPSLRMEQWVLDILTKFPPPKPLDGVTNTVAATVKLHKFYAPKTTFKEWVSAQAECDRNWYRITNLSIYYIY